MDPSPSEATRPSTAPSEDRHFTNSILTSNKPPVDFTKEVSKLRNLDTGEVLDFNDISNPNFIQRFTSLTHLNENESQMYVNQQRLLNERLWQAVSGNDLDTIRKLLDLNQSAHCLAQPNSRGMNGWTSLHLAASEGHIEIAELLLISGHVIDIEAKTDMMRTPLHWACEKGHIEVIELLLEAGADPNAADNDGNSPLHLAAQNGHAAAVNMLMLANADMLARNFANKVPGELAPNIEVANLLAEFARRKQLEATDNFSRVPFHNVLLRNSRADSVSKLLKKAARPLRPEEVKKVKEFLDRPNPQEFIRRKLQLVRVNTLTPRPDSIQIPSSSPISMTPEDFEIVSTLGSGAFGEVFQVKKVDTGEVFAMKVLDKEKYFKDKLLKYAMSERNVLCMLKHPFITQLHYAFQTAEKLVLIMEYCSGGDLARMLFKKKRFEEDMATNYICEVILALEELHNHNIIYRDLKPENILFDEQGHIKITDFGLSKEMPEENIMARTFCGTISYIAPEVIRRKGYTKVIDWYTVGVVFYEMLESKTPFAGGRREITIKNILEAKVKFVRVKNPLLKDLLEQLLAKNPAVRLGANGAGEIKSHPYFANVDWAGVFRRELQVELPEVTAAKTRSVPNSKRVFGVEDSKTQKNVKDWSIINR